MKTRRGSHRLDELPMPLAVAIGLSAGAAAAAVLLLHASTWAAGGLLVVAAAAVVLALSAKPVGAQEAQASRRAAWATGVVLALGVVAVTAALYPYLIARRPAPAKLEVMLSGIALPIPSGEPSTPPLPCPEAMVLIPGGTFMMGSPDGKGDEDEHPQHPVKLSPYCMDKTEVTAAQYQACMDTERNGTKCTRPEEGGYCNSGKKNKGDHPINCVYWEQAHTYCRWAGGQLPTEAEWEFAARGIDGREYPWGSERPSNQLCWAGEGSDLGKGNLNSTCAVGSYPKGASPFGLMDMAGNVWEWTRDWYGTYKSEPIPQVDPQGPKYADYLNARVLRGGGWINDSLSRVRASKRYWFDMSNRGNHVGFRCARGPNQ